MVSGRTKALAAGLALALLTALAAVSCGPSIGFLSSLAGSTQCDTGLATGGELVPVPSGDADAKLAFRGATWNVLRSNSVGGVAAGLKELARTADVISMQEFRAKFRRPAVRNALPGWAWSAQETSVPIAWNTAKFDVVRRPDGTPMTGRVVEFDLTRLSAGPVGHSVGPKTLVWVLLKEKATGAQLAVVNHHLLYHIESRGHPDQRVGKKYLSLAQKQIRVELEQVDRFKAAGVPVMVTKDGNWAAAASAKTKDPASPYIQAAKHGLYTSWHVLGYPKRGTHVDGGRLIDSVASTTATLIPVQQRILGRSAKRPYHGSDHAAVVVALTNSGSSIATAADRAAALTATTTQRGSVTRVGGLTAAQMRVAQGIYSTTLSVGRERSWSDKDTEKAFVIAASTAMKESSLGADPRSIRPDGHGDGGIYAQRTKPGWYGTIDQVNDPVYGTRIFLTGRKVTAAAVSAAHRAGVQPAGPAGYVIPGLTQVAGWPAMTISEASHRVQRSAFPQMPPQFEDLGRALLAAFKKAGILAGPGHVDANLTALCQPTPGAGLGDGGGVGSGGCSLDGAYAPGHKNPHNCDEALKFMQHQMAIGSRQWYRSCLALVANAYGWGWSGVNTAGLHAGVEKRAGKIHTTRTNIPRGAVMWWTNSGAGHVAIYDGAGHIYSNDVTGRGKVGRVKWDYPEKVWGQHFAGWSAPYFPNAGGSD